MLAEAAATANSKSQVIAAIRQASAATGSDFNYLLGTAMRESGLKSTAKASTSSATGLFQFIDQTWLGLVKKYGAEHGLGSYAAAIRQDSNGRYEADNPADRQAILALRNDPTASAMMEGEYANETKACLESTLGRDVCGGELYAAHFLGPDRACRLIEMSRNAPGASAAEAFPKAAEANRSVFYNSDGSSKTVREVYNWAMRQPNAAKNIDFSESAPAKTDAPAAPIAYNDSLFSPAGDFGRFAMLADTDGDLCSASTPFVLTPGVMSILASLSPDGRDGTTKN
jgi:hypothetical protein